MLAKKHRTHSCGQSNIDFRSQKDEKNVKLFKNWYLKKPFGTMGNAECHLKFNEYKQLMETTKNINSNHSKKHEIPDPRYYDTSQFYNLYKLPVKEKTFIEGDKLAELDESFKGKDKYVGDSMMISDLTKTRKNYKLNSEVDKELKGKI